MFLTKANQYRRFFFMFNLPAIILLLLFQAGGFSVQGSTEKDLPIGVNEKPGKVINLNYHFVNEQGDTVLLADLVDRPTILSFVYYTCPGICSPLLSGLQKALDKINMAPGREFQIITISINSDETAILAAKKKHNYYQRFNREFPDSAWFWMTGDSADIKGVTDEVGFTFQRTGDDFSHPAVIIALSPKGKIARYLYGIDFNPFDVKMALIEAAEGRVGPTIAKVIQFCFSYDPKGRTYVFNILKVSASFVLLFAMAFLISLIVKSGKSKPLKGN